MRRNAVASGRGAAVLLLLVLAALPALEASPQAAPSATPASGEAPLIVTFLPNYADGSLYQWQFTFLPGNPFVPDYASEIGESVSYTYQAPGTYTAHLRVYDATTGAQSDYDLPVTVFPPPVPPAVNLTYAPGAVAPNQTVTLTAAAVASPGRSISNYFWDLDNDGAVDVSSPGGPSGTATASFGTIGPHPVRVTAADNGGLAGNAAIDVAVSVPPTLTLAERPSLLTEPGVAVTLNAAATAVLPWSIASYDWDFGDGATAVSPGGGAAAVTHAYAAAGTYAARVTVTDTAGQFASASLTVEVRVPPAIRLDAIPDQMRANVWAKALPPPGDAVASWSWDFGDGSTATGPAGNQDFQSYLYSVPGTYTISVSANLVSGNPPLATTAVVGVAPLVMGGTNIIPPVIAMIVSVDGVPTQTARVGHVVTFTADAFTGEGNNLRDMIWDFDGDGVRDRFDDLTGLASTTASVTATYQYQTPGTYGVRIRVFEEVPGTSGEVLLSITVIPGTAPLECWIAQPRAGRRVWGNRLSLHARTSPALLTRRVDFKFRPAGSAGPWSPIGSVQPPPYSSLSVTWDVTALPLGSYEILAEATDTGGAVSLSTAIHTVTVLVDPLAPDQEENSFSGNLISQSHTQGIDPDLPTRAEAARETAIEFPAHAFSQYTTVRIDRPFANPHPLQARLQNLHFIPGSFRQLRLLGSGILLQPTKISLYQTNPNGILDDLDIDKTKLKVYQFDDIRGEWVPLFAQVSQPREDLVRATLVSMGDVGIVAEQTPRAPSSSSSGCGALGIAPLLLLAAARARTRRGRHRR